MTRMSGHLGRFGPAETKWAVAWDRINYWTLRVGCLLLDRFCLLYLWLGANWLLVHSVRHWHPGWELPSYRLWPMFLSDMPFGQPRALAELLAMLATGFPIIEWGVIGLVYVVITVSIWGGTPGMVSSGLRIRTLDGRRPGPLRILVRHLLSALSAVPLLAGYWWALIDPLGRTWHDILSGTVVAHKDMPAGRWRAR